MDQDAAKPRSPDRAAGPDDIASQAAMYQLMVENTADLIIRYNAARHRIYVSPSAREMLGYEPNEMLGRYATDLIHPDDRAATDAMFRQVGPALPSSNLTFRGVRKDAGIIWVEGQYRYLPEDGGVLAVVRDITDRKHAQTMLAEANATLEAANRRLQVLAQQDGLTGLANRRRFDELLAEEFRRARRQRLPLSLLLLDADHFKAYNDCYGHPGGDECLRQISSAIRQALRRPGDHAARYGGKEFVVLLPATDEAGALIVAEQIRAGVAGLAIEHAASPDRIVTVSIGTGSLLPVTAGHCAGQLIAGADEALYRAKAAGRNRVAGYAADVTSGTR